jgi:hypothetical protein
VRSALGAYTLSVYTREASFRTATPIERHRMNTLEDLRKMSPAELMAALLADRAEALLETGDDLANDLPRVLAAQG